MQSDYWWRLSLNLFAATRVHGAVIPWGLCCRGYRYLVGSFARNKQALAKLNTARLYPGLIASEN